MIIDLFIDHICTFFIDLFHSLYRIQISKKDRTEFLTMGNYVIDLLKRYFIYNGLAINRKWISHKHNMGLVLTKELFERKIKKYADKYVIFVLINLRKILLIDFFCSPFDRFCKFDDYNWGMLGSNFYK